MPTTPRPSIPPEVDLAAPDAAAQVHAACSSWGVFYLRGHGVGATEVDEALAAANRLFASDLAAERQSVMRHGGGFLRGYIPRGGESGGSQSEDSKEGFAYGYDWVEEAKVGSTEGDAPGSAAPQGSRLEEGLNPEMDKRGDSPGILGSADPARNALQGENVWPEGLEFRYRQALQRFFRDCYRVSMDLVRLMPAALGMDGQDLLELCRGGETISLMRVFHYMKGCRGAVGSSPHTDWGFWTVILQQEGVTALQVWRTRDGAPIEDNNRREAQGGSLGQGGRVDRVQGGEKEGGECGGDGMEGRNAQQSEARNAQCKSEWVDVPPIPGTLLVNVGDYLALLSKGRWVSPLHRVVATSNSARLSLVFFHYPNFNVPLPSNASRDEEDKERYQTQGSGQRGQGPMSLFLAQQAQAAAATAAAGAHGTSTAPAGLLGDRGAFQPPANVSFGEVLLAKWAQVQRSSGCNVAVA